LARLDELAAFAENRVSTLYPGHGSDSGIVADRADARHLDDFADAVKGGDVTAAEHQMLARYPDYRVRQFLIVFSLPAHLPTLIR
jgi:hypothetical protein